MVYFRKVKTVLTEIVGAVSASYFEQGVDHCKNLESLAVCWEDIFGFSPKYQESQT